MGVSMAHVLLPRHGEKKNQEGWQHICIYYTYAWYDACAVLVFMQSITSRMRVCMCEEGAVGEQHMWTVTSVCVYVCVKKSSVHLLSAP